jgi:hypothetical protein
MARVLFSKCELPGQLRSGSWAPMDTGQVWQDWPEMYLQEAVRLALRTVTQDEFGGRYFVTQEIRIIDVAIDHVTSGSKVEVRSASGLGFAFVVPDPPEDPNSTVTVHWWELR